MKEYRPIRFLPVARFWKQTGGIILFCAFFFAILPLLHGPAQNTGSAVRSPDFLAVAVQDIPEMEEPETQEALEDGAQTLRDPVCKRLLPRRPCKPVQNAASGALFQTKDVISLTGSVRIHFHRNFNTIPLQLRNSLFVRDGPETDVPFIG